MDGAAQTFSRTTVRRSRPTARSVARSGARLALALGVGLPAVATGQELSPELRLAQQFARDVNVIMEVQEGQAPPTLTTLETALLLSETAVGLLPDDADLWRQRLKLAIAADRPELAAEAADRIFTLDPDDQVARLMKVNSEIERAQTVEERIAAYERWLAPERRSALGGPVASRLALDLAILHERSGNADAFVRWLREAVMLDPGHRAAAAMASGYFRGSEIDAYGRVELLINLLLADPANALVQADLGQVLLEHGAYEAAQRMLALAAHDRPVGGARIGSDVFADLAMAQWAAGRPEDALRTIREQRRVLNVRMTEIVRALTADLDRFAIEHSSAEVAERRRSSRNILRQRFLLLSDEAARLLPDPPGDEGGPTRGAGRSTPLDRAKIIARLSPPVETVRTAILARTGSENVGCAIETMAKAFTAAIAVEAQRQGSATAASVAELQLQLAFVLLWLTPEGDVLDCADEPLLLDGMSPTERAAALVGEVDEAVPLSPTARARFAGWTALRRGAIGSAVAQLSPLAPDDPAARLGLALSRSQSERRDAARDLLAVARDAPGSLLSVWAADALFEMVGQRVPITGEAGRLNQLVATVPSRLDRCLDDPSLVLGLRVAPTKDVYAAFEPIIVEIEIANNWSYPLTIAPGGPIEPHVALDVSTRIAYPSGHAARWRTDESYLLPIIVDIDRRLTLAPRERLVIRYDLRRHRLGLLLDQVPIWGAVLRAGGMINFTSPPVPARPPETAVLKPSTLGTEDRSLPFRVEGVRFERAWIEAAMADVLRPEGPSDLRVLVMLSHIAGAGLVASADLDPETNQLFSQAMVSLAESYTRLDPVAQAWVLSVIQDRSTEDILAIARKSESRLVKMAYLLYCLRPNDPMLDAARRDDDPAVRQLAAYAAELLAAQPQAAGTSR